MSDFLPITLNTCSTSQFSQVSSAASTCGTASTIGTAFSAAVVLVAYDGPIASTNTASDFITTACLNFDTGNTGTTSTGFGPSTFPVYVPPGNGVNPFVSGIRTYNTSGCAGSILNEYAWSTGFNTENSIGSGVAPGVGKMFTTSQTQEIFLRD